jgi:malonyl CoA-acyl carrier protein transacylase
MTEGVGAPTGTCTGQYSSAQEMISRSLSDGSRAKDSLYRGDRARSTRFNRTAMAFFEEHKVNCMYSLKLKTRIFKYLKDMRRYLP